MKTQNKYNTVYELTSRKGVGCSLLTSVALSTVFFHTKQL